MKNAGLIAALILTALVLPSASILPYGGCDEQDDVPLRGGLKGYRETVNVSLPAPSFYGTDDPHYTEDVEQNSWEDIAFMVILQSSNKVTKTENQGAGSETAQCADIYQAAFVPVDGRTVTTGTQQRIMVEDFTATWCGYCTGVIGAMNRLDLDETMFPDRYIGVEWHSGGGTYGVGVPYDKAVERRTFYSLEGGIPRYVIDGMDPWVGGSTSANDSALDTRLRNSIQTRTTIAPISISAHAGHTSTQAWVEFTFTVESDTFNDPNVNAHVVLAQDAYPRRHGTNPTARLGWIGQDLLTQKVLQKEASLVQFREDLMSDEIGAEGNVEGEFDIRWRAEDKEDGSSLEIDLYYARNRDEWTLIKEKAPNTGSYKWDTSDPRVPDGDGYKVRIVAIDSDLMVGEAVFSSEFEINNPDPPLLLVNYPNPEGEVMTGTGEVRWKAWDDEDDILDLTVDIGISDDLGAEYDILAEGLENTGSYQFDTLELSDGDRYVIEVRVTDPRGLMNTSSSSVFSIFNNDPPTVSFLSPSRDEKVGGKVNVVWEALDQEDDASDLTFDLSIMFVEEGTWTKLASVEDNTGYYELDTLQLGLSDGDHRLRIMVRDSSGEYSEEVFMDIEIYNPDLPEILNTQAPRSPLMGVVQFHYTLDDPDAGETEFLSPGFYLSGDGELWVPLDENVVNTGTFDLDTRAMDDGEYRLKIRVYDPVLTNQFTEFVYPPLEINNPDAPTVNVVGFPLPGSNNTGDLSFSWQGSDADGDILMYYLYYSEASIDAWNPIYEGQGITANSFVWNTSGLSSGDYMLKIVVKDGSKADLEAETLVQTFHIYVPANEADDDDEDSMDVGSSGDDSTTLLILVVAGAIFILVLVIIGILLLMVRGRKPQPPQYMMPPPGQFPGPGATPQLPDAARQVGQLPGDAPKQLPPGGPPRNLQQGYNSPREPPRN
ncbi:MAG: hypothetical protein JXA22_07455 [Candidatus Thermoplasmatota archaeon]|nr:hypothetical protein [Candidatus Thermoplasmatota archaeon]